VELDAVVERIVDDDVLGRLVALFTLGHDDASVQLTVKPDA
jgi:hypothetical protein